jgi:hypothetical protein
MTDNTITSFKLVITWDDGIRENLTPDLPEYLKNEIEAYLQELEELRELQGDDEYNFSEAE